MFVVFDTNTYRSLVNGLTGQEALDRIAKIKEKEAAKGVRSLISSTVASELITHVLDGGRFEGEGDCTKALRVMYDHCGDSKEYGIVPSPEVQLAKELFSKEDRTGIQTEKAIVEIVYQLYVSPSEETVETLRQNIESIAKHNEEVERMMAGFLVKLAKIWRTSESSEIEKMNQIRDIQSLALISSIATKINYEYQKSDNYFELYKIFETSLKLYQERYPVPLQMMVDFCKKLPNEKFIPDKPERVNQVWDQRILHVAGQSIQQQPIILVTNDQAMLESAKNSKAPVTSSNSDFTEPNTDPTSISNNVMAYSDYISWLGFTD